MKVYPKIAHEILLIRAIFILEVYAYLVVAVTCKIRSSHAGLSVTEDGSRKSDNTTGCSLKVISSKNNQHKILDFQANADCMDKPTYLPRTRRYCNEKDHTNGVADWGATRLVRDR